MRFFIKVFIIFIICLFVSTQNAGASECLVVAPNEGQAPLFVRLTSGEAALEYEFDFGDGSELVKTEKSALKHTYREPGYYIAKAMVNNKECRKLVSVYSQTRISGSTNDTSGKILDSLSNIDVSLWFSLFLLIIGLMGISRYEIARTVDKSKTNK